MSWINRLSDFFFSPVLLARIFFVLIATLCGSLLADSTHTIKEFDSFIFTERHLYSVIAFFIAIAVMIFEYAADVISSHKILMAALGATVGLLFATLFYPTIPAALVEPENARMACNLLFCYLGIVLAFKHAERFHLSRLRLLMSSPMTRPQVLDSSVIIDGRIRELIDLGMIQGSVMVPNFVLVEIQAIADSKDPNRKARGRRGLDVLEDLRKACKDLDLVDNDYRETHEVDQKLVLLCREMNADLVTNDYNLQKIAQLHGIQVLNINEIANALRPAVYMGDKLTLNIVREGKEPGQGVGYLDDGTMVVIDDAVEYINEALPVQVTSILQTSSGRLVFARKDENGASRNGGECPAGPRKYQNA